VKIRKGLANLVRRRADGRCEYCRLPERLSNLPHVADHVIARQHKGPTSEDNLALACGFCNRHKGPNVGGIDGETGRFVRLFNPRVDRWADHFSWSGPLVVGRSEVGRVTVSVLNMNHPIQVASRQAMMEEGVWDVGP
jgi:hypothetical protein